MADRLLRLYQPGASECTLCLLVVRMRLVAHLLPSGAAERGFDCIAKHFNYSVLHIPLVVYIEL